MPTAVPACSLAWALSEEKQKPKRWGMVGVVLLALFMEHLFPITLKETQLYMRQNASISIYCLMSFDE